MEIVACQAAEINSAEIAAKAQDAAETLATLSSVEMSFVGGGCLAVAFA
jgi:hypothetical protein